MHFRSFWKILLHSCFLTVFLGITLPALQACSPLSEDDQLESIKQGFSFPGVCRRESSDAREFGSATLIDSLALGLPSKYENRVLITCAHDNKDIREVRFNLKKLNQDLFLEGENEQNVVLKNIQAFFYPDDFIEYTKISENNFNIIGTEGYVNDIAFVILDSAVADIKPVRLTNKPLNDLVSYPVTVVGYGMVGYLKPGYYFWDGLRRVGQQVIMCHTLNNQWESNDFHQLLEPQFGFKKDNAFKSLSPTLFKTYLDSISSQFLNRSWDALQQHLNLVVDPLEGGEGRTTFPYFPGNDIIAVCKLKIPAIGMPGNSGAGAFIMENNEWKLAGIYSHSVVPESEAKAHACVQAYEGVEDLLKKQGLPTYIVQQQLLANSRKLQANHKGLISSTYTFPNSYI